MNFFSSVLSLHSEMNLSNCLTENYLLRRNILFLMLLVFIDHH